MPPNLKKLQSIARRKLALKGSFEFKNIPKTQVLALNLGSHFLSTTTNSLNLAHTITYSDISLLHQTDVFHEFCRAKLNECGFTTIEAASLNAMRDCSKNDPKYIRDANYALVIASEVYSNYLLFSEFREESNERREGIFMRFESSDALTNLHTVMGLWGIAGLCYYKIASDWAQIQFPQKQIEQAINRAADGKMIQEGCEKVSTILGDLPREDLLAIERISDEDSVKIIDVILRLFSFKTGLQCES